MGFKFNNKINREKVSQDGNEEKSEILNHNSSLKNVEDNSQKSVFSDGGIENSNSIEKNQQNHMVRSKVSNRNNYQKNSRRGLNNNSRTVAKEVKVEEMPIDFDVSIRNCIGHLKSELNMIRKDLKRAYIYKKDPLENLINYINNSLKLYNFELKKKDAEIAKLKNELKEHNKKIDEYNLRVAELSQDLANEKALAESRLKNLESNNRIHEENEAKVVSKTKADIFLKLLIPYENLERISEHSNDYDVGAKSKGIINDLNAISNDLKENDNFTQEEDDSINKILDSLDNVIRDLNEISEMSEDDNRVKETIPSTIRQFNTLFDEVGIEKIHAIGEKFDPTKHNAMMVEANEEVENNYIIDEFMPGYMFEGKVIKPSQVRVCKK